MYELAKLVMWWIGFYLGYGAGVLFFLFLAGCFIYGLWTFCQWIGHLIYGAIFGP